jgi:hypothetical protein
MYLMICTFCYRNRVKIRRLRLLCEKPSRSTLILQMPRSIYENCMNKNRIRKQLIFVGGSISVERSTLWSAPYLPQLPTVHSDSLKMPNPSINTAAIKPLRASIKRGCKGVVRPAYTLLPGQLGFISAAIKMLDCGTIN